MEGGVEERLRRVEELLQEVLERLEALEELLASLGGAAALAVRIAVLGETPIEAAVEQALRVLRAARLLGTVDPITEAVLEALSDCQPHSISEVTRRVKKLRGVASRETIRKRLQSLLESGVVVAQGSGTATRYTLSLCRGGRSERDSRS